MRYFTLFIISLMFIGNCFAQDPYKDSLSKAHQYYKQKEYKKSGKQYAAAFKQYPQLVAGNQIYNAACSWALANVPDSAFHLLDLSFSKYHYRNFSYFIIDSDWVSLHKDKRWDPLVVKIMAIKQAILNSPLKKQLDSLRTDDQSYRVQFIDAEKKYGMESKEVMALANKMSKQDSINIKKVAYLLDNSGWPSIDLVGDDGVSTLFLVIQHADLNFQQKYYPMMKEAVKKHNLFPGDLALLEDRIAIQTDKKQIYGSQVGYDKNTKKHYVFPIEDEANVNVRRKAVGLQPLEDYLKYWNIVYNKK